MKFKVLIVSMFVIGMVSIQSIFAEEVKTDINFETGEVKIEGRFEKAAFNKMISIEVVNSDATDQLVHIGTIITEEDGAYSYKFLMPPEAETGWYDIGLGVYGQEKITVEPSIYYANICDVNEFLRIANADDVSAIKNAIETKFILLNMSREWYDKLDDDNEDYNSKDIIANDVKNGQPYEDISAVKDVVYKSIAVCSFSEARTKDEIKECLSVFSDVYNINNENSVCIGLLDTFGLQENRTQNTEKIYGLMANVTVYSLDEVISAYDKSVLLNAINCAKDPAEIMEYIENEKYKDIFGFNLDTYYKSNREKTVKSIYSSPELKTMSELEKFIEDIYKKQKSESSNNSTNNSGGSGGGGGSSSGGFVHNLVVPNTSTEKNNAIADNNKFTDIENVEWAKDAIIFLEEKGIISGMGNGLFEPDATVTREQFVKMIVNAFSLKEGDKANFSDVSHEHWAYNAICAAYGSGVVNGISETEFGLGQNITRQDMAVMVYKAAKYSGYEFEESELNFMDSNLISDYAKSSVAAMNKLNIIDGYPDGTFKPHQNATRAQAAKIIYAMIK